MEADDITKVTTPPLDTIIYLTRHFRTPKSPNFLSTRGGEARRESGERTRFPTVLSVRPEAWISPNEAIETDHTPSNPLDRPTHLGLVRPNSSSI